MASIFSNVEKAEADPILGLSEAYNRDTDPKRVNLGVGAYRTEDGKPYVLNCVKEVSCVDDRSI
jgi:aspartate/tyrosine/aromatic aminotransferase